MKSHEERVVLRRGRRVAVEVLETGRYLVARKTLPAKYRTVEGETRNRKAATAGLALPPSLLSDKLGQNVFVSMKSSRIGSSAVTIDSFLITSIICTSHTTLHTLNTGISSRSSCSSFILVTGYEPGSSSTRCAFILLKFSHTSFVNFTTVTTPPQDLNYATSRLEYSLTVSYASSSNLNSILRP